MWAWALFGDDRSHLHWWRSSIDETELYLKHFRLPTDIRRLLFPIDLFRRDLQRGPERAHLVTSLTQPPLVRVLGCEVSGAGDVHHDHLRVVIMRKPCLCTAFLATEPMGPIYKRCEEWFEMKETSVGRRWLSTGLNEALVISYFTVVAAVEI